MNPTSDSTIRETNWFIHPSQPLMEYKIFTARVGSLIYYVTARRGLTENGINLFTGLEGPLAITVDEHTDIMDNSAEQFNKLQAFLTKKA